MLLQMTIFHSFSWLSNIPLCVCVCVCVYTPHLKPTICRWVLVLVPHIVYYKQCCCEHWGVCVFLNYIFCLGICSGLGLLDHMVAIFSVLRSVLTVLHIYLPTNSVEGLPFLLTVSSIYL